MTHDGRTEACDSSAGPGRARRRARRRAGRRARSAPRGVPGLRRDPRAGLAALSARAAPRGCPTIHRPPALRAAVRRGSPGSAPPPPLRPLPRAALWAGVARRWPWRWPSAPGAVAAALALLVVLPPGAAISPRRWSPRISARCSPGTRRRGLDRPAHGQALVRRPDRFRAAGEGFAARGLSAEGGRLDYLDGRPVAALVYRRDKHLIDLFVWPAQAASRAAAEDARRLQRRALDGGRDEFLGGVRCRARLSFDAFVRDWRAMR